MDLYRQPLTRRSLPAIIAGILIGALVLTPSVSFAAKFLTKKRANKRYINVGTEANSLKTKTTEANSNPADVSMNNAFTDVLTASLAVPGAGKLTAQASLGMLTVGASSGGCRFKTGGTTMGQVFSFGSDSGENIPVPILAQVPVGAGTHAVTIECREGSSDVRFALGQMVLVFVPD